MSSPLSPSGFYASRLVLVTYETWLTGMQADGSTTRPHYYLGKLDAAGEPIVTVLRVVDAAELPKLRETIARHNAAVDGKPEAADPLPIDAERKRAALKRGGPSPLFNSGAGAGGR